MFDESFKFVLPGYNLRPLEMSGAIGLIQLKKFPEFLQKRKENAFKFLEIMKKYDDLIIQKEIGKSSWFGFSIVIRPGSSRLRQNLVNTLNEIGFECRPIVAGNFANNEVVKYFDSENADDLETSNWVDKNGLFIGNNSFNMEEAFNSLKL